MQRSHTRSHTHSMRLAGVPAMALLAGFGLAIAGTWAAWAASPPPIDAASEAADRLEESRDALSTEERESAIARVVAETPRTEAGGQDLYRRGLYPEALAVWEAAADAGDAGAAYKVGATYMDGQAVPIDLDAAHQWLERAAAMGEPRAMGDLGGAYDWGIGVEPDRAKAAEWYLRGAERGHPASQYNAAVFLEEGEVVEQDLVRAYMYYTLADLNGFPKYPAEAIEALTPKLTNDQIKRAIDAARAFEPVSEESL